MIHKKIKKLLLVFSALLPVLFLVPAAVSQALCISNKTANLRQGPGTHYEKLWQVFKYMPFKELGKRGDWYRVQDVDKDIYWVHKKLITKKFKCAVIKENKTNLRKGPGTNFPKVSWSPVDKYFSMKVLKIKNNWVRIEDSSGDRAWIYAPLVWIQ
ncbi:MAG: SH3 domain-containing protein [Nitrospinaceae bacterium]